MIRCGYLIDDNINLNQLIAPPHEFEKIKFTLLRSKFIVFGTKDEIFDWLKQYEELVCEIDQKNSEKNHDHEITFELYNEEEKQHHHQHHHHHLPKFLSFGTKKYNGSTKMRLEINAHYYDDDNLSKDEHQTPAMKAKGKNGIKLRSILNVWDKHHHGKPKTLNNQKKLRSTRSMNDILYCTVYYDYHINLYLYMYFVYY
ncbi:hypothetical protein RirG_113190 [Rhizophagus irregularis DAOM 197198w]|uniref:Uncharacterized protein n=1 Tax=Rhizophagus irregularis (strain DAOM 197198w) TaxID=1432141 RepID=A0A015JK60_RHIIW|nr:hypothetical protein RirG_113190 [Rhizophagus irregularis DAOM 197198w]